MRLDRRGLLLGAAAGFGALPSMAQDDSLQLRGRFVQGGSVVGQTWPRAMIFVDGEALTTASADGWFVIGFDYECGASVQIEARSGDHGVSRTVSIARGEFPTSTINGLPAATVDVPTDPALQALIAEQVATKTEAFASRIDADHFRDGFVWPLEAFRVTSRWGARRILNGTPARPHYGIDLAASQGTVVRAPAAGRIALAQAGMHFEGGLVLLDHGQGLITAYLHQSRLDVTAGQIVARGDSLGRVGMTGRATGPHLCWRMKWRDRNIDPSLLVGV
jgi:murein DD-endopeptidase MepM/ murein hydrolase activator NlpD